MRPQISVIVPVRAEGNLALLCESLEAQSLEPQMFEVLVVANGAAPNFTQSLDSILKDRSFSTSLLEIPEPGPYRARNYGAQKARGEILVFMDSDCRAQASCLRSIYEAAKKGGAAWAGAIDFEFLVPGKPNVFELFDQAHFLQQESNVIRRGFAVTANMSLRRELFEKLGGFNASLFSGGDKDLSYRLTESGASLMYLEEARVWHPARSTLKELKIKILRLLHARKHVSYRPLGVSERWTIWRKLVFCGIYGKQRKLNFSTRLKCLSLEVRLWAFREHNKKLIL